MSDFIWQPATEAQRLALDCEADILLFGGAAGSLKSETMLVDAMQERDNPNLHAVVFRSTYVELKDLIHKTYRLYQPLGAEYTKSERCWTFPSGARIRFAYLDADDDVYAHQGQEYSFVGFDEASHHTEFKIRYMLTRLRSTDRRLKLRMRLATNPGGIGHTFLQKMFLRGTCPHCDPQNGPVPGKLYYDAVWPSDGQPLEMSVAFIPGRVTDHNLLGQDYIKKLKMQSSATAQALLEGCWKQWEGQYFDLWNDRSMTVKLTDIHVEPWYTHFIGGDYGFTVSQAAAHLCVRLPSSEEWPNGRIALLDEYCKPGVLAEDYARELLERWFLDENKRVPELPRSIQMWAVSPDAWNRTGEVGDAGVAISRADQMNAVLHPYGFSFIKANNDRPGGWMHIYRMLRSGQLVICDHCTNTIDAIRTRIRDPKKFDDILKVHGDPLDDVADSFRYCLMSFQREGVKPRELVRREILSQISDPTSVMLTRAKFAAEEERQNVPIFVGRSAKMKQQMYLNRLRRGR